MFTLQEHTTIIDALEMAEKSMKRAMTTARSPEFKALYELAQRDIINSKNKLITNKEQLTNKEQTKEKR